MIAVVLYFPVWLNRLSCMIQLSGRWGKSDLIAKIHSCLSLQSPNIQMDSRNDHDFGMLIALITAVSIKQICTAD